MDNCKTMILSQMPTDIRQIFRKIDFDEIEEIRFRAGRPMMVYKRGQLFYIRKNSELTIVEQDAEPLLKEDITRITSVFLNSSVYAYLQDICSGFITLRGGHRVGLAGKCVIKNGQITNVTDISGVNLRVAHAYPGCAQRLSNKLIEAGRPLNTLLIAPPQCGKTTYLRDLTRIFSQTVKVTVVDERSEIAAMSGGVPQFDLGPQTDVLDRFPKAEGMMMALRSLSPQLLVIDEIGSKQDVQAVQQVLNAGCKLFASVHGYDLDSVRVAKPSLLQCFEQAVVLGRPYGFPEIVQIEKMG